MNSKKPLISAIIPVYNVEKYIEETIESVLNQTFKDFELILVDDKSTDDSLNTIKKKLQNLNDDEKKKIIVIEQEENYGVSKARNTGIKKASGNFIAFLDSDDIWKKEKLEHEINFFKELEDREIEASFVFHSYEFGDENALGNGKIVHAPKQISYRKALTRTVIFTSTVMFDMSKLKKEEIMMPDCKSEDTATWWNILRAGNIAYGLDEVLTIYRRPAKSLSSNKFKAIENIWNLYRENEKLSITRSVFYTFLWGIRATLRRM